MIVIFTDNKLTICQARKNKKRENITFKEKYTVTYMKKYDVKC